MLPPEGRITDEYGFRQYTDNEMEEGYDINQHADDDYE